MDQTLTRRGLLKRLTRGGLALTTVPLWTGLVLSACGSTSGGNSQITVFADANPQGEGLAPLVPQFEKETGIKVNYQVISETEITNKASVALAAGDGSLDVTWGGVSQLPRWETAGWIEPLDSYLSDTSLVGKQFNSSDFIPACWQATVWQGKRYGLPTLLDTNILMYRKDILAEHHASVPETIDELLAVCAQVNSTSMPAVVLRGKRGVHANIWIFNIFFYGEGGHYYQGQQPGGPVPAGKLAADLTNPAAIKGLEVYSEFFLKHYTPAGSAAFDFPETTSTFKAGRAAMLVDDIAFGQEMVSALGEKVGFAPAPRGPAGQYPGFDTQMWFLAKGSRNKEAAIKFMVWSTSPEIQLQAAKNGQYIGVTRQSTFNDPQFKEFVRPDLLAAFKADTPHLDLNHFVITPSFDVIGDYVSVAVTQAITGQLSPQAALAAAQQQAASYLATHPSS
ncbi:MAG: sugar ABC transporter substrate-binding protein [Thermogemmatispora sp.]|uniref:ABC transporter substrate-binding protein n=1 Tax=Thermogemmatispora sp. TaxID=1968838 RepID=UPI001D866D86|nr:sugar ABC transporter substrate-binding protein [Thermogemmatispora sp.]MBX5451907.1 sugar ABC transporter substrate-binding protein [Thermogemmatispora sp.]